MGFAFSSCKKECKCSHFGGEEYPVGKEIDIKEKCAQYERATCELGKTCVWK